jgi:hypothetical protein
MNLTKAEFQPQVPHVSASNPARPQPVNRITFSAGKPAMTHKKLGKL